MKGIGIIVLAIVILVIAGGIGLWYIGARNDLVRLDESINQSMSEIDNQLQRRSDLIPNFVNTVKGYAAHELLTTSPMRAPALPVRGQWKKKPQVTTICSLPYRGFWS
jgi:hypothetical protein